MLTEPIFHWDDRRQVVIPGDKEQTIAFAAENFVLTAAQAISQQGRFAVALSGGSTPKAIFERLAKNYQAAIDWSKVYIFWSDERAVPQNHPESNYKMALDSGFFNLSIPSNQIFCMNGIGNMQNNALDYQRLIKKKLNSQLFDLIMLGVGEDGHTASLFPNTKALNENKKLVAANYIVKKKCWRLTLTFPCINQSKNVVIYALGKSKESIIPLVLQASCHSEYPVSAIGTADHPALWILDREAAKLLAFL